MGLLLSVLVECVGVIEVISCYQHFQYGINQQTIKSQVNDKENLRQIKRNYQKEFTSIDVHDENLCTKCKEELLDELRRMYDAKIYNINNNDKSDQQAVSRKFLKCSCRQLGIIETICEEVQDGNDIKNEFKRKPSETEENCENKTVDDLYNVQNVLAHKQDFKNELKTVCNKENFENETKKEIRIDSTSNEEIISKETNGIYCQNTSEYNENQQNSSILSNFPLLQELTYTDKNLLNILNESSSLIEENILKNGCQVDDHLKVPSPDEEVSNATDLTDLSDELEPELIFENKDDSEPEVIVVDTPANGNLESTEEMDQFSFSEKLELDDQLISDENENNFNQLNENNLKDEKQNELSQAQVLEQFNFEIDKFKELSDIAEEVSSLLEDDKEKSDVPEPTRSKLNLEEENRELTTEFSDHIPEEHKSNENPEEQLNSKKVWLQYEAFSQECEKGIQTNVFEGNENETDHEVQTSNEFADNICEVKELETNNELAQCEEVFEENVFEVNKTLVDSEAHSTQDTMFENHLFEVNQNDIENMVPVTHESIVDNNLKQDDLSVNEELPEENNLPISEIAQEHNEPESLVENELIMLPEQEEEIESVHGDNNVLVVSNGNAAYSQSESTDNSLQQEILLPDPGYVVNFIFNPTGNDDSEVQVFHNDVGSISNDFSSIRYNIGMPINQNDNLNSIGENIITDDIGTATDDISELSMFTETDLTGSGMADGAFYLIDDGVTQTHVYIDRTTNSVVELIPDIQYDRLGSAEPPFVRPPSPYPSEEINIHRSELHIPDSLYERESSTEERSPRLSVEKVVEVSGEGTSENIPINEKDENLSTDPEERRQIYSKSQLFSWADSKDDVVIFQTSDEGQMSNLEGRIDTEAYTGYRPQKLSKKISWAAEDNISQSIDIVNDFDLDIVTKKYDNEVVESTSKEDTLTQSDQLNISEEANSNLKKSEEGTANVSTDLNEILPTSEKTEDSQLFVSQKTEENLNSNNMNVPSENALVQRDTTKSDLTSKISEDSSYNYQNIPSFDLRMDSEESEYDAQNLPDAKQRENIPDFWNRTISSQGSSVDLPASCNVSVQEHGGLKKQITLATDLRHRLSKTDSSMSTNSDNLSFDDPGYFQSTINIQQKQGNDFIPEYLSEIEESETSDSRQSDFKDSELYLNKCDSIELNEKHLNEVGVSDLSFDENRIQSSPDISDYIQKLNEEIKFSEKIESDISVPAPVEVDEVLRTDLYKEIEQQSLDINDDIVTSKAALRQVPSITEDKSEEIILLVNSDEQDENLLNSLDGIKHSSITRDRRKNFKRRSGSSSSNSSISSRTSRDEELKLLTSLEETEQGITQSSLDEMLRQSSIENLDGLNKVTLKKRNSRKRKSKRTGSKSPLEVSVENKFEFPEQDNLIQKKCTEIDESAIKQKPEINEEITGETKEEIKAETDKIMDELKSDNQLSKENTERQQIVEAHESCEDRQNLRQLTKISSFEDATNEQHNEHIKRRHSKNLDDQEQVLTDQQDNQDGAKCKKRTPTSIDNKNGSGNAFWND